MKHLVRYCSVAVLIALSSSFAFAADEDTQIEDELSNSNTTEVSTETFKLRTFNSCEDFEKVTRDFIKDYNSNNNIRPYFRGEPIMFESSMSVDEVSEDSAVSSKAVAGAGGWSDYSETNEQVEGVSESDIIKTDGDYIYYMADYYERDHIVIEEDEVSEEVS